MNRATKRLLAKQEAAAEREKTREAAARPATPGAARARANERRTARLGPDGEREGRIKRSRRFLREVRQELKKVAWPTRGEVFTYTVVVLFSVTVVTLYVFALDFAFAKAILQFFKS